MAPASSHYALYNSVLEPWTRLAHSAPGVINLRMAMLPWMMLTEPAKAMDEFQRMVSEKQEAVHETMVAFGQIPLHLWMDTWNACFTMTPQRAIGNAMIKSSRRLASPYSRRVSANRRRLSRPRS